MVKRPVITLPFLFIIIFAPQAQQIAIPRIEQMPNFPQPYEMRDWHAIAIQYDSLVFNPDASGQYLPLSTIVTNTTNPSVYWIKYNGTGVGWNSTILTPDDINPGLLDPDETMRITINMGTYDFPDWVKVTTPNGVSSSKYV